MTHLPRICKSVLTGGDLHYHLSQHGVFDESAVSTTSSKLSLPCSLRVAGRYSPHPYSPSHPRGVYTLHCFGSSMIDTYKDYNIPLYYTVESRL